MAIKDEIVAQILNLRSRPGRAYDASHNAAAIKTLVRMIQPLLPSWVAPVPMRSSEGSMEHFSWRGLKVAGSGHVAFPTKGGEGIITGDAIYLTLDGGLIEIVYEGTELTWWTLPRIISPLDAAYDLDEIVGNVIALINQVD